ncbi:hypothetical protein D2T31_04700 [Sinirhodobacter populi]|uniref:Uncharacterized protein n=1 Tax=Paenirhodobacter populi TaxID=2306993 RepID=A0A443KEQ5_9RHOB|nr:hypothetical protein [Sinirhodobacter populi]RWR31307.1 hypothetical protein D2T31_04700 [Sinirhodobacter populi]
MSGWFYLNGAPDAKLRLKAFSGASKNGKHVIRIEIETSDTYYFGNALKELGEVQAGQKPRKAPAAKKPAAKPLALPPPRLALSGPADE